MNESLKERKRRRLGPEDARRSRRAKRDNDIVMFLLCTTAILAIILGWQSI